MCKIGNVQKIYYIHCLWYSFEKFLENGIKVINTMSCRFTNSYSLNDWIFLYFQLILYSGWIWICSCQTRIPFLFCRLFEAIYNHRGYRQLQCNVPGPDYVHGHINKHMYCVFYNYLDIRANCYWCILILFSSKADIGSICCILRIGSL
jgi:hypothetical protein